jgi:hypothetical protein
MLAPNPYKYHIVAYNRNIAHEVARVLRIAGDSYVWVGDPSRLSGRKPPLNRIVVEFGWVYNRPHWTSVDREIETYLQVWNARYPQTIRTISLDVEHGVLNRDILQESERPKWMVREHVPSCFRSLQDSRSILSCSPF